MTLSKPITIATLLLATIILLALAVTNSVQSLSDERVSFAEHAKYASTRNILELPAGHCHNLSDLDNPTTITVRRGLWSLIQYSRVDCDDGGIRDWDDDDTPSTGASSIIYPTAPVILNDRRPICSFALNKPTSSRRRSSSSSNEFDVTFFLSRNNYSTLGGSYTEQVTSDTGCVSTCGSSSSSPPSWLPYSHTVHITEKGAAVEKTWSGASINIFSERWCQEMIHSNVGSGSSLVSITRREPEKLVRSIRFEKH